MPMMVARTRTRTGNYTALFHAPVLVLATCVSACAPRHTVSSPKPVADSAAWVNALLRSFTLEQKVGQMLMTRIEGDFDNIEAGELARALEQTRTLGIGGLSVGLG